MSLPWLRYPGSRSGRAFVTFVLLELLLFTEKTHAAQRVMRLDFSKTNGVIRPLHGINKGPIAQGGLINVSAAHKALGIPYVRLHDCQWPYPDIVDVHAIFRNPQADPAKASDYDFALTDEYLTAVRTTGARIIYRLGESIEHGTIHRFVHPPADPDRWADVCLGIIRHYNEGWAEGFRHGIRHWEIWNEPENRPAMWSGTDEDYFQLYAVTARKIRATFPDLEIGGPATGNIGPCNTNGCTPAPFVTAFLERCRRDRLPLDFFSWHVYSDDPREPAFRARAVRRWLDDAGFQRTRIHLNEWNHLPENSWNGISKKSSPETRRRFYSIMSGPTGAAYAAATLIHLQDSPVDVANFFHGEIGGFGLFDEHGAPNPVYHAFAAFNQMQKYSDRIDLSTVITPVPGATPAILGGLTPGGRSAAILISSYGCSASSIRWQLDGTLSFSSYSVERIEPDGTWRFIRKQKFDRQMEVEVPQSTVVLVRMD